MSCSPGIIQLLFLLLYVKMTFDFFGIVSAIGISKALAEGNCYWIVGPLAAEQGEIQSF